MRRILGRGRYLPTWQAQLGGYRLVFGVELLGEVIYPRGLVRLLGLFPGHSRRKNVRLRVCRYLGKVWRGTDGHLVFQRYARSRAGL